MERVKQLSIIALLLITIVVVANLGWNLRLLLRSAQQTSESVSRTSTGFEQYWQAQRRMIESDKNQKAIEAAIAVGATYQATGRLINTQIIPALRDQLKAGTDATHEIAKLTQDARTVAGAGRELVSNADQALTQKLLPEITAGVQELNKLTGMVRTLAEGTGASTQEVLGALNQLVRSGDVSVQMLNAKLQDPKLDELVAAAVSTTQHMDGITASLDLAAQEVPPMVRSARRWQTPLRWAQLISILAGILKPL